VPNASNNNPGRGQPVLGFDAQHIRVLIGAGLLRRIAHKTQKTYANQ
jgi:hypothetical protein